MTLLAATVIAALSATAIVPQVDYSPYFRTIDQVERTPECLRMHITLNHLPHYWVMIDSTSVLIDRASGREFRLIGHENVPFNTEIWMPDSGHRSGLLLFEPVPQDVKIVDLIEPATNPKQQTYGIHLDMPRIATSPQGLDKEDILRQAPSNEQWEGFNPKVYHQMDFVKPGATTLVRGHIDHHIPQLGNNNLTLTTRNLICDKENQTLGEIDSLGNFSMTVPVDYPQMALLQYGDMMRNIFLCPGDTFGIYTTTTSRIVTKPSPRLVPEYMRYSSANPDAAAITLLYDDAGERVNVGEYDWRRISKATDDGFDSVMALNGEIKAKMNRLVAEAPAIIDQYPVSPFAKDVLLTGLLVDTYTNMLELPMYWKNHNLIQSQSDDGTPVMLPNPDFKPIDVWKFHSGEEAYAGLVYDNPLAMCPTWVFLNRCEFFGPFGAIKNIASGTISLINKDGSWVADPDTFFEDGESRYERIRQIEQTRQDSCGLGDCFMQQLIIAKSLSQKLSTLAVLNEGGMDFNAELVSEILPLISYRALARQIVDDWADINREVGRLEGNNIADNSRSVDTESDVLAAVIEPYRGNVIYVDVWDMGCGPCRAGMLEQRELIKQTADKPLTVIYLNTEDEKDMAERWMRKNDIYGEHVYVSNDNRARLSADFDITGIPYGILIDKKGNIRQTKLHGISLNDPLLQQLLNE